MQLQTARWLVALCSFLNTDGSKKLDLNCLTTENTLAKLPIKITVEKVHKCQKISEDRQEVQTKMIYRYRSEMVLPHSISQSLLNNSPMFDGDG